MVALDAVQVDISGARNSGAREWYYVSLYGEQCGPVTDAQLRELHQSGFCNGSTMVWTEALDDWVELHNQRLMAL